MNDENQMCCLCLNISSFSMIYLVSKNEDSFSYFDKISLSLFNLADVLNEKPCDDYMICTKCSETIIMIYTFNRTCLQNVRKYNTYREALKLEILDKKQYEDANDSLNEFVIKEEVEEPSEICHDGTELEIKIKKELCYETETVLPENEQKKNDFTDEGKSLVHTTDSFAKPGMFEPDCELEVKEEDSLNPVWLDKNEELDSTQNTPLQVAKDPKKIIKRHTCILCKKDFATKSYLDKHFRIHAGVKPYTCDICFTSFRMKAHLSRHMLVHTGIRPYSCELCSKAFCTKQNVQQHMLTHSGEKPYVCNECGKKYSDKSNLMKHKRIHTGLKPYSCDICGKQFTINSHLKNHVRMHTGEKPFSCEICSKSFTVRCSLTTHLRSQHNL